VHMQCVCIKVCIKVKAGKIHNSVHHALRLPFAIALYKVMNLLHLDRDT